MPRRAREYADTGFYHVIHRGNGRQLLFEDDRSRRLFLKLLTEHTSEEEIDIIAWCLMSNHVHLILHDEGGRLSEAMHGLATSYARYFNGTTGHVGSVFQDRFTSVPIKDDRQLLRAVRYVHENPAKAGIAEIERYPWSSYGDYLRGSGITHTATVLDMLGGPDGFLRFCSDGGYGWYYARVSRKVSDDDALQAARAALCGGDPGAIKALPRLERDAALCLLRDAGVTLKQIERLTGIGRSTVMRATKRAGTSMSKNDPVSEMAAERAADGFK